MDFLSPPRMSTTNTRQKSIPVSFDCPAKLAKALEALAKARGVTLAGLVASLVVTPLQDQLAEVG